MLLDQAAKSRSLGAMSPDQEATDGDVAPPSRSVVPVERREMSAVPELHAMIEGLKRKQAFHQEREAFHAGQEAHHAQHQKIHMEEKARHSAELAAISPQLEELQGMAQRLGEVATQSRGIAPPETDATKLGPHPNVSKALDQVIASWPPDLTFTATTLAAEIHRRYATILRRSVPPRVVGAASSGSPRSTRTRARRIRRTRRTGCPVRTRRRRT